MNDGTPGNVTAESDNQRRRSARLNSPPLAEANSNKMAVKRSITVRKITAPRNSAAPPGHSKEDSPGMRPGSRSVLENIPGRRTGSELVQKNTPARRSVSRSVQKNIPGRRSGARGDQENIPARRSGSRGDQKNTAAPPGHGKENSPGRRAGARGVLENIPGRRTGARGVLENSPARRSGSELVQTKKRSVSTPGPAPGPAPDSGGSSSAKRRKKQAAMPSPILPSSPPPASLPPQPDPEDSVWSQKVRRSYSRLSDRSFRSPDSRETLFGFEKLQTPEVVRRPEQSRAGGLEVSGSLNSFTSLLEADDGGSVFPEPDPNIPGVAVVKERRRRRKVQQIPSTELEVLAARMNAEFEEAEEFQLVVE